jgi:hypothetical protein
MPQARPEINLRSLIRRIHDGEIIYVTDGDNLWQVAEVQGKALFRLEDCRNTHYEIASKNVTAVRLLLDYRLVKAAPTLPLD